MNLFMTSVSGAVESIDYLKENINDMTQLIVMPFAHHFDYHGCAEDVWLHYDRDPYNNDSILWRTVRPFLNIGINPDRVVVINIYGDPIELIKQKLLADNTIVYFPGGFPENIVKLLNEFRLIETVKKCKIVVGESAGSMFWSRKYFVYPDNDYRKYKCYRGIKMIKDFVIIPHYNPEDKKQCRKIMRSTRRFKRFHKETVYLMRDGGWLWYNTESKIKACEGCDIV